MLDSEDILRWIVDNYSASTILEWMNEMFSAMASM